MAKDIDHYLEKRRLTEHLSQEVADMEQQSEEVRAVLELKKTLEALMKKQRVDARQVLGALRLIDDDIDKMFRSSGERTPPIRPTTPAPAKKTNRQSKPLQTYQNPHTGEIVKTRGGNHKVLNAWRDKYGKDTVNGWKTDD